MRSTYRANPLGIVGSSAQFAVPASHQYPTPLRAIDRDDPLGDTGQNGLQCHVANQCRVQLGQQSHAAPLAQGLLGTLPHPRDETGGNDRHAEIDEQGQYVIRSRDGEGQERRDKEEVEG